MRPGSVVRLTLTLLLGLCVLASTGVTPAIVGAAQQGSAQQDAVQQRPQPGQGASVPGEIVIQYVLNAPEAGRQAAKGRVGAVAKQRVSRPGQGVLELASLSPGLAVADAARSLHGDPTIAFVEPNFLYFPAEDSNDPYYINGSLWGLYGDGTNPANQYGS